MRYLSVCSGIEAASVAWHPLSWEAVAFSEIEPFPCAVLAHHWPAVPNLGDMTAYKEWPLERGTVDLLVGGTPCQSFSVAGLRAGLDDPRGSLMLVYLAIARRFAPRWVVWENVPGVLSSHRGRDFGTFLGGLAECGYGFAYRVLDAQFFGVPQRRRRVFVVGYLGNWRAAAAVLFEHESLRGYPAPSREAGERVAATVGASTPSRRNGGSCPTEDTMIAAPLTRGADSAGKGGYAGRRREDDENLVAYAVNAHGGSGRMDGESETFVSHALRADGFDASEDGTGRGTPLIASFNAADGRTRGAGTNPGVITSQRHGVRRLTPRECERLQGFPDDYTLIRYPPNPRRVKWAANGPRYRALGNSMAVPCMRWLGERIQRVEGILA
jgi:DNA (cytosine-5)-methyltransferase 1